MKTSSGNVTAGVKIFTILLLGLACAVQLLSAQQPLQVAAWGLNGYGQTWVPKNLSGVKAVAPSQDFALALLQDGTVTVWGGSAAWQTNLPSGLTNIAAIAACPTHCLALRSNGTVVGWGDSAALSFVLLSSQVTNPPVTGVKAIAVGWNHSVLVQSNGTVRPFGAWAFGFSVASAPGPQLSDVAAVATSDDFYVVLKNDGTVAVRVDINTLGQSLLAVPVGLSDVRAVAAGFRYCMALKSNGTVVAWGLNYLGLTNVPSGLSNVVAIAACDLHSLALQSDGTLASWGSWYEENIAPEGLTNIVGIAAGVNYSMALVSNTSIIISKQPKGVTMFPGSAFRLGCTATGSQPLSYQWQRNSVDLQGATNPTLLLTNISQTEVGDYRVVITNLPGSVTSTVARVTLGPILVWGSNFSELTEPPAGVTNPVAMAASGQAYSPWAVVNSDGTVATWGGNFGPIPADLSNVVQVAAGDRYFVALRADGTVEAWGYNSNGQLDVPANVTNAIAVAAGSLQSLALKEDGTVVAWGSNFGTNVPAGLNNVSAIDAEFDFSFALTTAGTIRSWGGPGLPSLTNFPSGLTNLAAMAVGNTFGLALRTDGTITNWGSGGTPPPGLSNIVAVAAGRYQALALRDDGMLVSWGTSLFGETTIPAGLSNIVRIASGVGVNAVIVGDGRPAFPTRISKRSVRAGGTLELPAFAASSVPMTYQWFFNGQPLENQTNATLRIPNAPATVAGDFRVVVSNAVGVVTSVVMTVTVTRDPVRFDTSADGLSVTNESAHLRLTGLAGAGSIVLYASTNLADWEPIYTNPPVVGVLDVTDFAVTNNPARYYRAVEGP